MAKRATKKKSTRPVPLTADRVRTGWHGPADTRIRLTRGEDCDVVDTLLATAGVRLIPALRSAVEDGTAGASLLVGLGGNTKTFHRAAAGQIAGHTMAEAMSSVSLTLTAADGRDQPVGALSVTAPGTIIEKAMKQGYDQIQALTLALGLAKVHGLAVSEAARGQGIAAALLKRAWQVYEQLGYFLLYGSYEAERNLGGFYSRCGYTTFSPGEGFSLERIGMPFGIHSGPGECSFARWRPRR
jgi:GNAT superfamily N-acetyltransferase